MRRFTRYFFLMAAFVNILLITSACHNKSDTRKPAQLPDNPSEVNSGSVLFKIQEVSRRKVKEDEEVVWLSTHASNAGMARFKILLVMKNPTGDPPFASSDGAFIRERDSQPAEFLKQVAKALEAKRVDTNKPKAERLEFRVALLGQNLSRGSGANRFAGSFTSEPPGPWIASKVFVADGEGEFFLNLNPEMGVGEISIKDAEYGDIVLQELARVF